MPHGVSRIERVAILTFSVSEAAPLTRRASYRRARAVTSVSISARVV